MKDFSLPGEGITSPLRPEAGVDEAGLRPGGGARDHHDGSGDEDGHDDHGDEDGHDDHGDEDGHDNHGDDNDEWRRRKKLSPELGPTAYSVLRIMQHVYFEQN